MEKVKQTLSKIFKYNPIPEYNFSLPDINSVNNESIQEPKKVMEVEKIFPSISKNLEYIQSKYNVLINSDIITREFNLYAGGNNYRAFLLYIDGMVDSNLLNDFVLKPLMLRETNNFNINKKRIISETTNNNVTIRKVKKFDLGSYIENCLIPQNSIKKTDSFGKIFSGVNSGDCALFVDTLNLVFDIDVKGFKQREINKPENEIVVKGSHEAFVENIRTNTSILRRVVNNENLIIENFSVGDVTKTKCAICYMNNIANSDLIAEIKYRINNLGVDYVLSTRSIRGTN